MISVIIPFHNEESNLTPLQKELIPALERLKQPYEVIFVDDGSTDASASKLKNKSGRLRVITHRKRLGKGRALTSGFKTSQGDILVFMDADLQDDSKDIVRFIQKIEQGFDLVNGWRKKRIDPLSKTLPSSIFNFIFLRLFFRSKFHDVNCGFKAMRRGVLEEIPLYGDNYRFLPIIAERKGFKTGEVEVAHRSRLHGKSKYGFWRMLFGFLDTVTVYFIYEFAEKPLHFFGPIGGVLFLAGFVISFYLAIERLFFGVLLYNRPLLLFGVVLIIVGIQIAMTGIIGELIVFLHKKKNG